MPGPVRGVSAALITVVTVALVLIMPANAAPASPFIAYSTNSFFRTPLPRSGVPVAARPGTGIAYARNHDPNAYPQINGVQGNRWGEPFDLSDCSDPVWKLTGSVPSGLTYLKTE